MATELPSNIESFHLVNYSEIEYLAIATEVIKKIGWELTYISSSEIIAYTYSRLSEGIEEFSISIKENTVFLKSQFLGNQNINEEKNIKNIELFKNVFKETSETLTYDDILKKTEEISNALMIPEQNIEESDNIPYSSYPATLFIVGLNVGIFIVMLFTGAGILSPGNEILLKWGANFAPLTLENQPWRLLTACFLHIGIFHLLMNMFALIFIGQLLEPSLGKIRLMTAYLITGVAASLTSISYNNLVISAGASGAIFGMFGVFMALLLTKTTLETGRKVLLKDVVTVIMYNLILTSLIPNIDNAAHIGGLLSGILVGFSFYPGLKKRESGIIKYTNIILTSALFFGSIFYVYTNTSNDIGEYDKKINEFVEREKAGTKEADLMPGYKDKVTLAIARDSIIMKLNQNIKLLDEMDKLKIPDKFRKKNEILKRYCEVRIKVINLIYKSMTENSDKYDKDIKNTNKQINQIIEELKDINKKL